MAARRSAIYIHLSWGTWERLPLLQRDIQRQAYRLIGAKCKELGAEIVALGGVEDHVHLLISLPPTLSTAQLVKYLKGFSSRVISEHLAASPTQSFKWQDGYGAVSVSPSALHEVARYIAQQREHHTSGSLVAAWEDFANEH